MPKFYDLLGVAQGASPEEVKKAYKKAAFQNHPDKGGDPEKFKEIGAAYAVLSDEGERNVYDQIGDAGWAQRAANGGAGGGGGHGAHGFPDDMFAQMFGGGGFPFGNMGGHQGPAPDAPVRRANHVHGLRVSLAEAYSGIQKTVKVSLSKCCMRCQESCYTCQGRGIITDMRRMGFMTQLSQRPCDNCKATGRVVKGRDGCGECGGRGTYSDDRKLDIRLPPGVAHRSAVVFNGLGEQPVKPGDTAGDLIFEVNIADDAVFQREGADLVMSVPVTFAESVLGKTVRVPHFGGEFVVDTNAEFGVVGPGEACGAYVVPGKGMPRGGGEAGKFGDLKMMFRVGEYPQKEWTAEQKAALGGVFGAAAGAAGAQVTSPCP